MEAESSLNASEKSSKAKRDDTSMSLLDVGLKIKKSKKKDRKRKYSSSTAGSEDESSTKKLKSKHKKKCKKRHKHTKDKRYKLNNKDRPTEKSKDNDEEESIIGPEIPDDLIQKAQSMAPMSKEEWEKRQNTIRRVYDEETGRSRLIRGEGEIIEEIVSRERHQEINRLATQGDGNFFQSKMKKRI